MNEVIMKIIDIIMLFSPYGALMAALMVEIPDFSISALGIYGLTVLLGLFMMAFVFYPTLLMILLK
jgi:Na+/H+-dicarboxylate symporter